MLWKIFGVYLLAVLVGCTYVEGGNLGESTPAQVTFMDVGQGLAVLLEFEGRFAMYDVGPDSACVLDSLQSRGVDTLEWVLLSHNHRDHAGALLELDSGGSPRVYVRRLYMGADTAGAFVRDSVLRLSRRFGIPVDTVHRGDRLVLGGFSAASEGPVLEVVWPPEYVIAGENEASSVARMVFGESSVLLTGDLDSLGERRLLELAPTISASLLQVPHHGSASSSSLRFLSQLSPDYAVISVGKNNTYGHPTGSVLRKLEFVMGDSARIFRTDRDGSRTFDLFYDLGVVPH